MQLDKTNVRSDMVYYTMKNRLVLMVMPSKAKDVNLISAEVRQSYFHVLQPKLERG